MKGEVLTVTSLLHSPFHYFPKKKERLWGEALRDDTKNSCVADYTVTGKAEKSSRD